MRRMLSLRARMAGGQIAQGFSHPGLGPGRWDISHHNSGRGSKDVCTLGLALSCGSIEPRSPQNGAQVSLEKKDLEENRAFFQGGLPWTK